MTFNYEDNQFDPDDKPSAYERGVCAHLVGMKENPFEYGSIDYLDWENGQKYAREWNESQLPG